MSFIDILPESKSPAHDSAHLHVAGESEYVDDRPLAHNELFVGLIYSPHARARIKKMDVSEILALNGVVAVFTADSLQHNAWGSVIADQPLLAVNEINYAGEIIAVIAASSSKVLREALPLARISYEILPPILSIKDAIKHQSFIGTERILERGDAKKAIALSPHKLSGNIMLGGAEHFYLENQGTIAYPLEDGHLEIHCSTQHPTEVQHVVAEALGLPQSKIVTITKRLGGGFGGKETQAAPFAVYAALVAHHCKRPARLVLSKDDDMVMTGKRNPYLVDYEVGFDEQGKIQGLLCTFFGDGGAYADLSTSILERAMTHADNAYFIPHAQIRGIVCRTNFHPHTAFRGFGGPKGVAMIEHVMEEIAHHLKVDALDIRKLNCYQQENNVT
ncbi:MAG TPA: molybdopterin cofactor-binding domain-containing protein, partial [Myxococcota bacterium]|nr:molybdopterin cofactor-binding domain-containing protein [Myxococcota bacterium]